MASHDQLDDTLTHAASLLLSGTWTPNDATVDIHCNEFDHALSSGLFPLPISVGVKLQGTSNRTLPAAYHGDGWAARHSTLADDVAAGTLWRRVGTPAEWATLRTVVLAMPDPDWPVPADWNTIQYLQPVDFGALRRELSGYADVLRSLGVEVVTVDLANLPGPPLYNGIFVRDQFLATSEGVVIARMGSSPRAGEERVITAALATAAVPIVATIRGAGCFEGADALRAGEDLLLVGVGNRTNDAGARQLADLLADGRSRIRTIPLPRAVQHLLGLVQLVDTDLAVVRTELSPPQLHEALGSAGIEIVGLPESPDVRDHQAMNFVTVDRRRVVMLDSSPEIARLLTGAGIDVAATVRCPELPKAAGGLACATGVLLRELPCRDTVTAVAPGAGR